MTKKDFYGRSVNKASIKAEIPLILKNDMIIQFHEDRIIDLEERKNGDH